MIYESEASDEPEGGRGTLRASGTEAAGGQDETTTTSFEVIRAGCTALGCQINLLATLGTRVPIIKSCEFPSTLAPLRSPLSSPSFYPICFRLAEPFERREGIPVPAFCRPSSASAFVLAREWPR